MSLSPLPEVCPRCASVDFAEIGRVETNDLAADDPPTDRAVYLCDTCGKEWEQ